MTRHTMAGLSVVVLLQGCGRVNNGSNRSTSCVDDVSEVSDEEVTDLGFAAEDVLAVGVGAFEATATLVDMSSEALSIDVERGRGSAELVRSQQDDRRQPWRPEYSMMVYCPDSVRVPATLTIRSTGGAVDLQATGWLGLSRYEEWESPAGTEVVGFTAALLEDDIGALPVPREHDPAEMDETSHSVKVEFGDEATTGAVTWTGRGTLDDGTRFAAGETLVGWTSERTP